MAASRRLINAQLQNAFFIATAAPRLQLCVRKDMFPTTALTDKFTKLLMYTSLHYYRPSEYQGIYNQNIFIPFILPKVCYCDFKTDPNLSKCICSPLESCVAIHVEVNSDNAEVSMEAITYNDSDDISKTKNNFSNLNVNTHLIISSLSSCSQSKITPVQLTFKDKIEKRYTRTFGEGLGDARLSIYDPSDMAGEDNYYDISIVQASDKDLGIDDEWEKIKRWANLRAP